MSEPLKAAVLAAVRRLAQPLARLLLEAGIGAGEFQALMKGAFVRAAGELGDSPRPNASRIASLTGLTRRDVAALLQTAEDAAPEAARGHHRIQRVLTGWWTDPDFQDRLGQPAVLPLRGAKSSFASLVKRYSGEPRVLTILDELLRVKAVRRHPDGKLEAASRHFATARWDSQGVAALGEQVRDHLDTMLHHLKHPSRPRYHRVIQNVQLDPSYVPMLLRDITSQADTLADSLEDALNDPAATVKATDEPLPAVRLGVAFYVFEAPASVDPIRPAPKAARPRPRGR